MAILVLSTMFAGALTATIHCARLAHSAKAKTAATAVLNTKIEELRAMPFTDVKKFADGAGQLPRPASGSFTAGPYRGTYAIVVDPLVSTNSTLLRARITIRWLERNRPLEIQGLTYFSSHGLVNKPNEATNP